MYLILCDMNGLSVQSPRGNTLPEVSHVAIVLDSGSCWGLSVHRCLGVGIPQEGHLLDDEKGLVLLAWQEE